MASARNADQAAFWNEGPGLNWAAHSADLDALHAVLTPLLIEAGAAGPGDRVLDVGCGAGATSFALAEAVGHTGQVLGVDISAPLLARAEEARRARGLSTVRFELADAQDHRFEAGGVDLVASRMGVMFFDDPVAAFANLAAALRPGGRIAFVAWAGPEHNPWFAVPRRVAVRRLGAVLPSDPDAPGPMAFRDVDRVFGILRAAGFANVAAEVRDIELHHPGGLEPVTALLGRVGPVPGILREKGGSEADRAAILAEVAAEFSPFASEDGIRIPARVNLYTAARPAAGG